MDPQPCRSNKCNGAETQREYTGSLPAHPLDPDVSGPVLVHRCVRCGMRYFSKPDGAEWARLQEEPRKSDRRGNGKSGNGAHSRNRNRSNRRSRKT